MQTTQPLFIVSSGRSGTQMLEKLLGSYEEVEMYHEYKCNDIQPLAVKYSLKIIDKKEALAILENIYSKPLKESDKEFWGDSSNKLSWLIPLLNKLFPNAKFIHLIRDGRKVVSSFFNKLGDECYDDESTKVLQDWVDNPKEIKEPPREKKYWWNVAKDSKDEFRSFDQFQRICYHWKTINETIQNDLENIENDRKIFIKLEDLVTDELKLKELMSFIGLNYKSKSFNQLQRPHNVNIPKNFSLTKNQYIQFNDLCKETMIRFEYDLSKEYKVEYDQSNPIKY